MYSLTLTASERQAIDWIGDRYATGDEFYDQLQDCIVSGAATLGNGPDVDWSDDCDIDFTIPEHVAWIINDLFAEEDNLFPCFAAEFKAKLLHWAEQIV